MYNIEDVCIIFVDIPKINSNILNVILFTSVVPYLFKLPWFKRSY